MRYGVNLSRDELNQKQGALYVKLDLGEEFHNRAVEARITAFALMASEGNMQRAVDEERVRVSRSLRKIVAHVYTVEEAYAMAEFCSGGKLP